MSPLPLISRLSAAAAMRARTARPPSLASAPSPCSGDCWGYDMSEEDLVKGVGGMAGDSNTEVSRISILAFGTY